MFDTYSQVTNVMNFSAQKWIYAKKPTFYTFKESLLFKRVIQTSFSFKRGIANNFYYYKQGNFQHWDSISKMIANF